MPEMRCLLSFLSAADSPAPLSPSGPTHLSVLVARAFLKIINQLIIIFCLVCLDLKFIRLTPCQAEVKATRAGNSLPHLQNGEPNLLPQQQFTNACVSSLPSN